MYDVNHPVYLQLQKIGREITTNVKPKAVVVFSAHWQADSPDRIEINNEERTDLIYEYVNLVPNCLYPMHWQEVVQTH